MSIKLVHKMNFVRNSTMSINRYPYCYYGLNFERISKLRDWRPRHTNYQMFPCNGAKINLNSQKQVDCLWHGMRPKMGKFFFFFFFFLYFSVWSQNFNRNMLKAWFTEPWDNSDTIWFIWFCSFFMVANLTDNTSKLEYVDVEDGFRSFGMLELQ